MKKHIELFRELTEREKLKFKAWARENYKLCEDIKGIWHPVVQAECVKMNEEIGDE
jgi:hypothetical protein